MKRHIGTFVGTRAQFIQQARAFGDEYKGGIVTAGDKVTLVSSDWFPSHDEGEDHAGATATITARELRNDWCNLFAESGDWPKIEERYTLFCDWLREAGWLETVDLKPVADKIVQALDGLSTLQVVLKEANSPQRIYQNVRKTLDDMLAGQVSIPVSNPHTEVEQSENNSTVNKGPRGYEKDKKRAIVERYLDIQSTVTQEDYAGQYDIDERTLRRWIVKYKSGKL